MCLRFCCVTLDMGSFHFVLLLISIISLSTSTEQSDTSIIVSSICGRNSENCYNNCKTTVKVNDRQVTQNTEGLFIHITFFNINTGRVTNTSISLNEIVIPPFKIRQLMKLMRSVQNDTIIIVTSQGCGILPSNVKSILRTEVKNIDLFEDFKRVNIVLSCKGKCPIEPVVFSNDEAIFTRGFIFSSKGTGGPNVSNYNKVSWIVGTGCALLVCIVLLIVCIFMYRRKKEEDNKVGRTDEEEEMTLQ